MSAHLVLEGGNQLSGELAVREHRPAVHDASAQALVRGEAVLLDEEGCLVAQGGPGHAQEVQGDGLNRQLHRPLVGVADVVVVGDLRMQTSSVKPIGEAGGQKRSKSIADILSGCHRHISGEAELSTAAMHDNLCAMSSRDSEFRHQSHLLLNISADLKAHSLDNML